GSHREPSVLRLVPSDEAVYQGHTCVSLHPISHDGIGWSLEARDVRDQPLAPFQPPGNLITPVTAIALAHSQWLSLLGDSSHGKPVFIKRNIVGSHLQLVPLLVQLFIVAEVALESHLALE